MNGDELRKSTSNESSLKNKCHELYDLSKELKVKREELVQRGLAEKEAKDYYDCTFSPSINGIDKSLFDLPNNLNEESYKEYVNRQRQIISGKNKLKSESKSNKGSNKRITIPREFRLSCMRGNEERQIEKLVKENEQKGIRIHNSMKFSHAMKYLQDRLRELKL